MRERKQMKTSIVFLEAGFILAGALLAAGCVSVGQKAPPPDYYMLSVRARTAHGEVVPAPEPAALHPALLVAAVESDPPFDRRELQYRSTETQWKRDYYNRFMASPGEMVTEETRRWLREAGVFGSVVGAEAPIEPDYVLRGKLHEVYGDYRGGGRTAVLDVEFSLVAPAGARGRLLMSRDYAVRVPLAGLSPKDLVAGLDSALVDILTSLTADLGPQLQQEMTR
jgi:ABC-type uncharacterized transport system auxiliary subunit